LPDIAGNTSTTASITVGGVIDGQLETATVGDHDWYRIYLTAGQSISVTLAASGATGVEDTYLALRDSSGNVIKSNDDSGGQIDLSKIAFTATTSGVYYIDAGSYDSTSVGWNPDYAPSTYAGTYTLSVQAYTPPAQATYDTIATQLVSGWWTAQGTAAHHFNVTQGGTLTYDIDNLNADGQRLATAALALWSDIIGVTFQRVDSTSAQIFFDDNDPDGGAYSEDTSSGGFTTQAWVNIADDWLVDYGSSLNSYGFQTYVHEIGHALGLGHAGNYNGDADYLSDALFQNDAWSTSIMSYFSQVDNSYFAGQNFSEYFAVTPMNADIIAMQRIYGLSTTTRTGDTTYGFNSNAGRDVFNANLVKDVAYTIFDNGGTDTLDYSGFFQNQTINLNAESFSNVGAGIGNVMIARGVVIENAIGGTGNDTLVGNAASNKLTGGNGADNLSGNDGDDFLDGGFGADTLSGGAGNDRIVYDASDNSSLVTGRRGHRHARGE
jgi:serralysin